MIVLTHNIGTSFLNIVNEVDGDALVTLMGTTSGPDCLKELVPKVGIRMKVYKLIKCFCDTEECVRL